MKKNTKGRNTQRTGKGFCLLPWGEIVRSGEIAEWSSASIAVLPVIAAHANKAGEAWPSYDLISALARISKTTVAKALEELSEKGLIVKTKHQGVNTYNKYQLCIESYDENPNEYIAIHHKLIFSGTWGSMTPSERRVYLVCRAFSRAGLSAIHLGYRKIHTEQDVKPIEVIFRGEYQEFNYSEVQFLPEHIYDPAKFTMLAGVKPRTFRAAMVWLIETGLLCPYIWDGDEGDYEPVPVISGFIIPLRPPIIFRQVIQAVEKVKKESLARKGMSGAKRSFTALHRRVSLVRHPPKIQNNG